MRLSTRQLPSCSMWLMIAPPYLSTVLPLLAPISVARWQRQRNVSRDTCRLPSSHLNLHTNDCQRTPNGLLHGDWLLAANSIYLALLRGA